MPCMRGGVWGEVEGRLAARVGSLIVAGRSIIEFNSSRLSTSTDEGPRRRVPRPQPCCLACSWLSESCAYTSGHAPLGVPKVLLYTLLHPRFLRQCPPIGTQRCAQRNMLLTVNATNVVLIAALLGALAFSSLHLHKNYRIAGDGEIKAAFVILVGPTNSGENRTRGLEIALHSLWFNYIQEHPRPVYLFIGDDIPADQYTPAIVQAITPPGMHAEAIHVPGFKNPPDNMRTVVLHSIMAGGKYPGQRIFPAWHHSVAQQSD